MKQLAVILFLFGISFFDANAQKVFQEPGTPERIIPRVLFGFGTGINAYSGLLGLDVETVLNDQMSVRLSGGLGGWGFKYGTSFNYFFKNITKGNSVNLGVSFASGTGKDNWIDLELETVNFGTTTVPVALNTTGTINLMYAYNTNLSKKGKVVLGIGYAINFFQDDYSVFNGIELTNSSKQFMRILEPGGPIFEIRLMFGV